MRRKIFEIVLSLYLAIVLTSCAAVNFAQTVTAVDPGTTIRGMQMAVNGLPGTYVLQQGENLVLGWPSGTQYAWVALSQNGQLTDALKAICGNRACPEAMTDLYNYLVNNGWQVVSSGAIPATVSATVRQMAYLLAIGASLPLLPVLFMPVIDPMQLIHPEIGA